MPLVPGDIANDRGDIALVQQWPMRDRVACYGQVYVTEAQAEAAMYHGWRRVGDVRADGLVLVERF